MRRLRAWFFRLGGLFNKQRRDRELAEELESHLQMHIEDNLRAGMSGKEAHRQALIKLGGIEQTKENCRDRRGLPLLETLMQDVRYGIRMLRKNPGFAAVAVLTLALGIGASTAIFTVINAVMLRPLPYAHPERLAMLWPQQPMVSVSKAEFAEFRKQSRSFETVAVFTGWSFTITGKGEPEELPGARATTSLFATLGVRPLLGRTFLPEEDQAGHSRVAVLSYGLWQRRFGSDPSVIGQAATIDGISDTVVGVMPPGFAFPTRSAQLWLPAPLDPTDRNDYSAHYLMMIGRLKERVLLKQAQNELRTIARRLHQDDPKDYADNYGRDATAVTLLDHLLGDAPRALLVLLGAVGFVLLIACANVAGLLVARSTGRNKELAIRSALGASRGRVARQLLVESLLLALAGDAAGVLFGAWGLRALIAALPADTPRLSEISLDGRVLCFSLGITLITGVLFGLAPVIQASRQDVNASLKDSGRSTNAAPAPRWLRGILAASQVALALVLVIGAALMIRSFSRLSHVDPGLNPGHLLSLRVSPPDSLYPGADFEHKRAFYHQILEQIRGLPGVESVGAIHLLPFGDSNWNPSLEIAGRPVAAAGLPEVDWRLVTPYYFRTVGTPLLRGRFLTPSDQENTEPVTLINSTMARRFWPGEDPIGEHVRTGFDGKDTWVTIVGVVGDVKDHGLGVETRPQMYRPYDQRPWATSVTVMVRASLDPLQLANTVRHKVWAVDKNVPVSDVQTMERVISGSVAEPRFHTLLLSMFSATALMLAAVGIYGTMSYAVVSRTHEIGLRMALGAGKTEVLRMVIGRALTLALMGVATGLVMAVGLTRLMSGLLYGVRPTDPATFGGVAILLTAVSILASYIPARRAMGVDPTVALRHK